MRPSRKVPQRGGTRSLPGYRGEEKAFQKSAVTSWRWLPSDSECTCRHHADCGQEVPPDPKSSASPPPKIEIIGSVSDYLLHYLVIAYRLNQLVIRNQKRYTSRIRTAGVRERAIPTTVAAPANQGPTQPHTHTRHMIGWHNCARSNSTFPYPCDS